MGALWRKDCDHMRVRSAKELGTAVRAARLDRGISQAQLAAMVGMTRTWLGALERGTANPSWDVVLRVAHLLDLWVDVSSASGVRAHPGAAGHRRVAVDLDALLDAHRGDGS